MLDLTCRICASPISRRPGKGRQKTLCSENCRAEHVKASRARDAYGSTAYGHLPPQPAGTCAACGAELTQQGRRPQRRYCSAGCRNLGTRLRAASLRSMECAWCLRPFIGRKRRFCGTPCTVAGSSWAKNNGGFADRSVLRWVPCRMCGDVFLARGPGWHCPTCVPLRLKAKSDKRVLSTRRQRCEGRLREERSSAIGYASCVHCRSIRVVRCGSATRGCSKHERVRRLQCVECDSHFMASAVGGRKVCSDNCWVRQRSRRSAKARAKRRELLDECASDEWTATEIHERDGWRCQICWKRLKPETRWPNPAAASIDHVIPLNAGGDDTRANVQCACLGCNWSKNDSVGPEPVQLRLIG